MYPVETYIDIDTLREILCVQTDTDTHVCMYVSMYTGGEKQQSCETHQPATMKHNENSKNRDETSENGARTTKK